MYLHGEKWDPSKKWGRVLTGANNVKDASLFVDKLVSGKGGRGGGLGRVQVSEVVLEKKFRINFEKKKAANRGVGDSGSQYK